MRKFTLLAVLMVCTALAFAQSRSITGQILDENGTPVPFATIKIKGTTVGTSADANGKFTVQAKTGDILVASAINFSSVEKAVDVGLTLNFSLQSSTGVIEEVVVTAQGIRKKPREIGYAYAKVSAEEITVGRSPQLAQALSGKISGLAIYNVNNSVDPQVKVVLRGYRSLTGNNEALVVIDGMQTTQTSLALLNPNDIENVTVLKGGQAATLYGSDGVNGAIIITTKKGQKGKIKVGLSTSFNIEEISFLPEFQTSYGSGSHYAASFGSASYKPNYLDRMHDNWRPFENQQYGDAFNGEERIVGRVVEDGSKLLLPYSNVKNGRKKSFDKGRTLNNQVSFQGGDERGSYYMSLENNNTEGIVPHDKSQRTGVRLAASRTEGKLSANFSAAYTQAKYDRTTSDFYYNVLNTAGNIPLTDFRDWPNNKFANPNGYYNDYYPNPYFTADNNRAEYADNNIQGTMEVNYKLFSWLNIYDRIGVMSNNRTRKNYTGKFVYSQWAKNKAYVPAPWAWANDYNGINLALTDLVGGTYDATTAENVVNNEFQLHFNKDFGDFSNKLITGFSVYQRKTKFVEIASGSVVVPEVYNISNRVGDLTGSENNTTFRKFGYYADLTSDYKNYLYLNASARYDASSKFYKVGRSSDLWSYISFGGSLSFVATDAFPSIKSRVLDFAKIRIGVNKNGNDNLSPYQLDVIYPNGIGFPFGGLFGATVGDVIPDPDLRPEVVYSYEIGGEVQLFKNKLSVDFAAYRQDSKDAILTVKLPNTTGFPNLRANVADAKNWGYEADVKVQIMRKRDFSWDFGVRYSYNDNKIESLYQNVSQFVYGGYSYASTYMIKDKRYPFLKASGYERDPATGMIVVDASSGYPSQAPGLLEFGGTLPKHILGAGSKLGYKNFEFAFNFEYRGGNVVFHQLGRDMTFTGSGKWTEDRTPHIFPNSTYKDASGKFVPNTSVNVRESEYALWVDYYRFISENFVTPGWFIKLREVNLSYRFSENLIKKTRVFSAANVALFGRNLLTIVDEMNYYTDPEFSYTTGNGIGINNSSQTPPVRQYGINLNLTF
jgi:TonB-linked SusC/RagA family outer membrane protein